MALSLSPLPGGGGEVSSELPGGGGSVPTRPGSAGGQHYGPQSSAPQYQKIPPCADLYPILYFTLPFFPISEPFLLPFHLPFSTQTACFQLLFLHGSQFCFILTQIRWLLLLLPR